MNEFSPVNLKDLASFTKMGESKSLNGDKTANGTEPSLTQATPAQTSQETLTPTNGNGTAPTELEPLSMVEVEPEEVAEAGPAPEAKYGSAIDTALNQLDSLNYAWRVKRHREEIVDVLQHLDESGQLDDAGDVLTALGEALANLDDFGPKTAEKTANALAAALGVQPENMIDLDAPNAESSSDTQTPTQESPATTETAEKTSAPAQEEPADNSPEAASTETTPPAQAATEEAAESEATESTEAGNEAEAAEGDEPAEESQEEEKRLEGPRGEMLARFTSLVETDEYLHNLFGGNEDRRLQTQESVAKILAEATTNDPVELRVQTLAKIIDIFKNSRAFRVNDRYTYAGLGYINKLMDETFGPSSEGDTLIQADGTIIKPGDKQYEKEKQRLQREKQKQGEAMIEVESQRQKQETNKDKKDNIFTKWFRIGGNGQTEMNGEAGEAPMTAEAAPADGGAAPVMETPTPVVEAPTETVIEAPSNGMPIEENGSSPAVEAPAAAAAVEAPVEVTADAPVGAAVEPAPEQDLSTPPELTIEAPEQPVMEANGDSPVAVEAPAEVEPTVDAGAAPVIETETSEEPAPEAQETQVPETAEETPEAAPEEVPVVAAEATENTTPENQAEKFQRAQAMITSLEAGVKDDIRGLTDAQVTMLGEAAELVDELNATTEEEATTMERLAAVIGEAYLHQVNFLKVEQSDTWEVKAQKYLALKKTMDSELEARLETPEGQAEWQQELADTIGPREKSATFKGKIRPDWRNQILEKTSTQRQERIAQTAQQNKERTKEAVLRALDSAATVAGNLTTIPERVGGVKDVVVTKALNIGDRVASAYDTSLNMAGTVGEIYVTIIPLVPAGLKAVGAEALLGVSKAGERVDRAINETAQKGVDYVKQKIADMRENMRAKAEREEAARQERLNKYREATQAVAKAAQEREQNAGKLQGLRNWFRGLQAR